MSSLQRYKKSGGFLQLLSLLESFGPQKRAKFLEMIDAENMAWGNALREKLLTVERFFNWPDQVIIEVYKVLPVKIMAAIFEGLKDDQKKRLMAFFSPSEKRKMDDILAEWRPKPEDISTNMIKLLEMARKMINTGEVRPEKYDPTVMIPEDYEGKLDAQPSAPEAQLNFNQVTAQTQGHKPVAHAATETAGNSENVLHLQRTLALIGKENKSLKDEVRILREKLDQIKRIA